MAATEMNLVYIVGTYPLLTTTFIDREIVMLRQWGIDIQVVAIRRPDAGTPLSVTQKQLQQGVIYLLPVNWLDLLLSHLYFIVRRPRRLLQTVSYLLTRPHATHKARLKTLLHCGEGVYAAYLLRERPFREFHAHFVDRAATVALVAGRLLDKAYSLSVHAGADIFVDPVLLDEKISEARHVATCTDFNKHYIERLTGRDLSRKMTHIKHGLELDKYPGARKRDKERPLILAVGQLVERKGFHQLIEACFQLKQRGYEFDCRIIGRGQEYQALQEQIVCRSLADSVVLCGALPHDEVIAWYQQATLFVLPCIQSRSGNLDGIPNVLAEAMAMELPVISTTISAIPELIDDEVNGLLVPPEDVPALTSAIASLLNDPVRCANLGTNARHYVVATFDVERNVRHFAATLWPEWVH